MTALTTVAAHASRLGLDRLLAAESHLPRRDPELLVLASETPFLIPLELLELLLEPVDNVHIVRKRGAPRREKQRTSHGAHLFLRRSFLLSSSDGSNSSASSFSSSMTRR